MNKLLIATVVSATMLTGCANMSNEQQGQVAGVAIGTILAHNASKGHKDRGVALVLGALAGGFIGSQIGASLDERDRQLHGNTTYDALETQPDNTVSQWNNPHRTFWYSSSHTNLDGTFRNLLSRVCSDYLCWWS